MSESRRRKDNVLLCCKIWHEVVLICFLLEYGGRSRPAKRQQIIVMCLEGWHCICEDLQGQVWRKACENHAASSY